MNPKLFINLFLLLTFSKAAILTAIPSISIEIVPSRNAIGNEDGEKSSNSQGKNIEATVKIEKEEQPTPAKKLEDLGTTAEQIEKESNLKCQPKVVSLFIPIQQQAEYLPFPENANSTLLCPNLKNSCCESEQLMKKKDDTRQTYQMFTYYAEIGNKLKNIVWENADQEQALKIIPELETKQPGDVTATENVIAAAAVQILTDNTRILNDVIDKTSLFLSGFLCQMCNPKSHQYFVFQDASNNGTLTVNLPSYDTYFSLAIKLTELQSAMAKAYRVLLHSKSFTTKFPTPVSFGSDTHYSALLGELNKCANKGSEKEKVEAIPECKAYFDKNELINKLGGLDWLKDMFTQVVNFLDGNYKGLNDILQFVPHLVKEVDFMPPNSASTISFTKFKFVYDTTIGFSMTENMLNPKEWKIRMSATGLKMLILSFIAALIW